MQRICLGLMNLAWNLQTTALLSDVNQPLLEEGAHFFSGCISGCLTPAGCQFQTVNVLVTANSILAELALPSVPALSG